MVESQSTVPRNYRHRIPRVLTLNDLLARGESVTMDRFRFERRLSLFTAVFIVALVGFLVIRNQPFADPNLVVLARIILALAIGILGATIPGFLQLTYNFAGFAIRATGALALFVIAFFGTPHVESLHLVDTLELQTQITKHLFDSNNCETALGESKALLKITPNEAIAHNLNGNANFCLGNVRDALAAFDDATKLDPNYKPAQYNKAAALIRLGKYANAEEILSQLVATEPTDASDRYNLAITQAALKKYHDAFQNFSRVYTQDQSFDSSLGLGFLYILDDASLSEDKSAFHFRFALSVKPAIVCVLYGKLPLDRTLLEAKPFIDIAHLAEGNPAFLRIRAKFDSQFKDAICQDA
jgi:tetratricopeptide (TPR) repeat protein